VRCADIGAAEDIRWMREALALAARGEGRTAPNPPVGAVIVARGRRIATGWHRRAGGPHAEVLALRKAGAGARGATVYVTLEPCATQGRTPPCVDALIAAGVGRVVAAVRDPNPRHMGRGLRRLRAAGITVQSGVLRAEAARLIAPFAKWVTSGVPYVVSKAGMTLDGRIADRAGRSRWITSPAARRMVQDMRRRSDAVLVGAGTAAADNPSLTVRRGAAQPYRVIVDGNGRTPADAVVFRDAFAARTILATTRRCPAAHAQACAAHGAAVWRLPGRRGRVDLGAVLTALGRLGVLRVLCEGGGEMNAALLDGGWIDEAAWFVAPAMLGGSGVPVIGGAGRSLADRVRFRMESSMKVGPDILVRAVPLKRGGRRCSRD
jgi:diaminohydroxyphosphoribosylaminopyrimidine deaminase / 5-amino-6-(5-phosphoribosylamino)uracil reductase